MDTGAGNGQQGQGPGGEAPVVTDWESLLAQLPEAGFEPTQFYYYKVAVHNALRAFYAQDRHVTLTSISPPEDEEGYVFEPFWGLFAEEGPPRDPLSGEASVDVEFWLRPAEEPAPSLAGLVSGQELIRWTSDHHLEPVLEALARMWEPMLRGYSAVGPGFWEAFRTLHQVAMAGHLSGAGGEFQLPGPAGYDLLLWFRGGVAGDYCIVTAQVRHEPWSDLPPQPEPWETLMSEMPQAGFGAALASFSESMLTAVRQTWAGEAAVTVAETGRRSSADGNWQETTFSWLRFPVSEGDPGYLLETLTLRLTPRAEGAPGPLVTGVTVTELVAWDPEQRSERPSFVALAPARDFFLEAYLSPGDGFWQAFGELELAPGLSEELLGANGTKILVVVEEVSEEDGAIHRRYTLTYLAPAGG